MFELSKMSSPLMSVYACSSRAAKQFFMKFDVSVMSLEAA